MNAGALIRKTASIWPVLIILFLTIFIFREAVFPVSEHWILSRQEGDVGTLYYYWRSFGFDNLKRGIIPLWNPYIFCGVPFTAYPESALFYPLNLIFLFLPLAPALNLSFVLHLFLLGIFQFLFLRYLKLRRWLSLLGAFVLMLSAPVILAVYAGHLSNVCTIAWVPLLFLLAEGFSRTRKLLWAAGAGFILALQILAGHWQYVYYTLLLLGLYLAARFLFDFGFWKKKRLFWLGGVVICLLIAAGLTAVQTLPALEASRGSFRKSLGYEWAANFSLPPINLITFIIPGFLGDTVTSLYWGRYYFWEMCAYAGFLTVLLALMAVFFHRGRITFLFTGLAALSIILALGAYTPLFKILCSVLPGYRLFRGSSKFLFFAAFSISVLAAFGANELAERIGSGRRRLLAALAICSIIVGLAAWLVPRQSPPAPRWWKEILREELMRGRHYDIVPPGQPSWWMELMSSTPPEKDYTAYVRRLLAETPFPDNSFRTLTKNAARLGFFSLLFGLLLAGKIIFRKRSFPLSACFCLAAALEMIIWSKPYIVGFDSRLCRWDERVASFFKNQTEPFRYLSIDPADFNRGMAGGFSSILGYQADATRRYLEYINVSQGYSPDPRELVPLVYNFSRLLDLLNLSYIISPPGTEVTQPGSRKVLSTAAKDVWTNPGGTPRVLVSAAARTAARGAVLRQLQQPSYSPREYVILEEPAPSPPAPGGSGGSARLVEYSPCEAVIEAESENGGFLLFNDAYSPGWKAFIDGEEAKISRANYLMRAVFLEEGEHTVRFVYRPVSFRVGLMVSASTLSLLVIAALITICRRLAVRGHRLRGGR